MKFNIYLFLSQCLILGNKFGIITVKAIIGQNVRQASSGEFTYVVSIMTIVSGHPHSEGDHFCTGTLITKKNILTAAHCLYDQILNTIQMVIGTIDLRNGTVYYPLWWETYNQWATSLNITVDYIYNDMANIRILLQVPENILPARLSRLSNIELYEADVVMVGWGLNNEGITPDIMQVADLKVLNNPACQTLVTRNAGVEIYVEVQLLCTHASPYVLIEEGDSGGPLLFRNRIVALNRGTCPSRNNPSYNQQVNLHLGLHYYRDFISFMKRV